MKIQRLTLVKVETIPDVLEDGFIYVSEKYETAIHLCACGCGEQTVTPWGRWRDGWQLSGLDTGNVTLYPSIGNQCMACKSHYWVRDGATVDA